MALAIALAYAAAVVLLVAAAFGVQSRANLALMGAACALLGFALPALDAGFH